MGVGGKGRGEAKGDGAAKGQGGKGGQVGAAKDPVSGAISEIKKQIREQGGQGRVKVENWQERFGAALGPLRDFLESRPDKFLIEPTGKGKNNFVVSEVEGGGRKKRRQDESLWEEEEVQAPPAKKRRKGGGGDEAAAVGPPGPAKNPVAMAIQEIKQQLHEQGGAGKVWIENWRERYGELGTLQQFLDSRPDKFAVSKQRKGGFTVALAGPGGKGGDKGGGKGAMMALGNGQTDKGAGKGGKGGKRSEWVEVDNRDYSSDAIGEIKMQLKEQGGEGNVWIEDWGSRYAHALGGIRQFLESRPDKFVVSGQGKRFTVAIVGAAGAGGGKGKGKASKGAAQPAALALTNGGASGGKGKDRGKGEGKPAPKDPVSAAIKEIKFQLKDQGGHGKVRVEGWKERFAPSLGSLVEFLEARPDKFTLHAAGRGGFTVSLAELGLEGVPQQGAGGDDAAPRRRRPRPTKAKGGGKGGDEEAAKPTQKSRLWSGASAAARKASARLARNALGDATAGGVAPGKKKGKGGGKGGGWGSGGEQPAGQQKSKGARRAGGKGAWS